MKFLAKHIRPDTYFGGIFSGFQYYRKAIGGVWYPVNDLSTVWGGRFWSQYLPEDSTWQEVGEPEQWEVTC